MLHVGVAQDEKELEELKLLAKAKKIAGITIIPQGIIPKEKANLAKNVANVVESHLLDKEEIHKLLNSKEFQDEIKNLISSKIDEFEMPNITEFIKSNPEKVATNISDFVMEMIKTKFPFAMAILNEEMIRNMEIGRASCRERV